MKIAELFEGDVVKGSFGKKTGRAETSIDVPPGFDRFKQDGKKIIGIKGDKERVVSTTSDEALARALVKAYNNDGKTDDDIKPLSWAKAFGSAELGALEDAGVKITEKPGYWDDFEEGGYAAKKNITQIVMKKVEKALGKKLKVYTGDELFGEDNKDADKPRGPLVTPNFIPKESMFIVHFNDGTKYLCDLTGANTYIRNWQKIV